MAINHLLDEVSARKRLANDAALARTLKVMPPVISKLRHGKLNIGPALILRIHELAPEEFSVRFIRDLLALEVM